MSSSDSSGVSAGWYPDPEDPSRLRLWDGTKWTAEVVVREAPVVPSPMVQDAPPAPAPASAPAPEPAPQPEPEPEPEPVAELRPTEAPAAEYDLPDWATLPGITLPPDLSGIPGLSESEPRFTAPEFKLPDFDSPATDGNDSDEPAFEAPPFDLPLFEPPPPLYSIDEPSELREDRVAPPPHVIPEDIIEQTPPRARFGQPVPSAPFPSAPYPSTLPPPAAPTEAPFGASTHSVPFPEPTIIQATTAQRRQGFASPPEPQADPNWATPPMPTEPSTAAPRAPQAPPASPAQPAPRVQSTPTPPPAGPQAPPTPTPTPTPTPQIAQSTPSAPSVKPTPHEEPRYVAPPPLGAPRSGPAPMTPLNSISLRPSGTATSAQFVAPQRGAQYTATGETKSMHGGFTAVGGSSSPTLGVSVASGSLTVGVWLMAFLPVVQFALLYLVFGVLAIDLSSGAQWGILAGPAILALIFAEADRRRLRSAGHSEPPSPVWAIIPPLYLLIRCFKVGPKSAAPLLTWLLLQAACAAAVYALLPAVVTSFQASPLGLSGSTTISVPISASPAPSDPAAPRVALTAKERAKQLTVAGMEAKILADTRDLLGVKSVKCPALASKANGTQVVCTAKTAKGSILLTERVDSGLKYVAFSQVAAKMVTP